MLIREQLWLLLDEIGCHSINPDELENPYVSYNVSQPFFIEERKLENIKINYLPFQIRSTFKSKSAKTPRLVVLKVSSHND